MKFYYCYIIYSPQSKELHISSTDDLKRELQHHNDGKIKETEKNKPWNLLWYGSFRTHELAEDFYHFLNTTDGEIFLKKWLVSLESKQLHEEEKPINAKTCPVCGGSGKAANDMSFYRGNRYSKNVTTCLTCIEKGWVE